jgi:hypothetical protein
MLTIAALDLSLRSAGWAHWRSDAPHAHYGHWQLADGIQHAARGFVRLHKNLSRLNDQHGEIDVLAIEQAIPAHMIKGNTSAAVIKALAGLEAHAVSFAEAIGARWHLVNIGGWRRSFLGRIPAKDNPNWKQLAQNRAREFGMSTAVHDEAEAIGILDYQAALEGFTPPWRMERALVADLAA